MYCDTVVGVGYGTKYKLVPSLFSRLTIIEGITFRTESNCEEVKWERNEDARTSRKINNNEVSNFSYPKRINLKIKKLVWDDIAGGRRPPAIEGKSNNILRASGSGDGYQVQHLLDVIDINYSEFRTSFYTFTYGPIVFIFIFSEMLSSVKTTD